MPTQTTWSEANKICQRSGPPSPPPPSPPVTRRHLAAIANTQENNFVADLTGGKQSWIGGFQFRDGAWGWTDGQKWDGGYTNWYEGQPDNFRGNQDSVVINFLERGLWDDARSGAERPYVCQYLDLTKIDLCRLCGS